MKNLLEEKDIALKILKELNKLVTIPDRGFLAGGAVANTLLRMKNGKGTHDDKLYPINDLDIFVEADHENIQGNTPLRTFHISINLIPSGPINCNKFNRPCQISFSSVEFRVYKICNSS